MKGNFLSIFKFQWSNFSHFVSGFRHFLFLDGCPALPAAPRVSSEQLWEHRYGRAWQWRGKQRPANQKHPPWNHRQPARQIMTSIYKYTDTSTRIVRVCICVCVCHCSLCPIPLAVHCSQHAFVILIYSHAHQPKTPENWKHLCHNERPKVRGEIRAYSMSYINRTYQKQTQS